MRLQRNALTSYGLALAIVAAWWLSAIYLEQSLFATQRSRDLLQLGAADGNLFATHEGWRLLVSQLLHVHLLHMLFNVACIVVIGTAVEKAFGWLGLLLIYFVGGTAGQFASVVASPTLVSSGASQALMALCAAAILISGSRIRYLALAVVAIQVALDVYVAGTIKVGHSVGFGAGLLIALGILFAVHLRSRRIDA